VPEPVEATALTIVAAATSGVVCYLLSLYQHTVGKQAGSLSLISQSIDSKNHVFVAIAALVGIIFARSGIFLVDSIVALAVAILVLKSAVELAAETVRVAKGEQLDLAKFGRAEAKLYERFRRGYLKRWMLFSLTQIHSKAEMVTRYNRSFSTEGLPIVDQFSFVKGFDFDKHVDSLLKELVDEGLVIETGPDYRLTAKGSKMLKKRLASQRYMEI